MKVRLDLTNQPGGESGSPRPRIMLRVRDRYGTLAELLFRVDTPADFTTVPITLARREGSRFRRGWKGGHVA